MTTTTPIIERGGPEDRPVAASTESLVVADLVRWPSLQLAPDCPSDDAFWRMRESGVRHGLVVIGDVPIGVVCQLDAAEACRRAVSEIANPPLFVSLWQPASAAVELLSEDNACAVAVRVPGRPCGMISRDDLARAHVCGPWSRCESCGSDHRVRSQPAAGVAFCAECLESIEPSGIDDLYVDVGTVD